MTSSFWRDDRDGSVLGSAQSIKDWRKVVFLRN